LSGTESELPAGLVTPDEGSPCGGASSATAAVEAEDFATADPPPCPIPAGERPADDQDSPLRALEDELGQAPAEDEAMGSSAVPLCAADCPLPESLTQMVNQRLRIWGEILALEERRQGVSGTVAREIRDELSRQDRELQRPATMENLLRTLEDLKKKLANPLLPSLAGKERPPAEPNEPKPEEIYRSVLEIGLNQSKLLLLLAYLDAKVPAAALPAAEGEPLLEICRRLQITIEPLMGWTYYAMGLFRRVAECRRAEDEYAARAAAARAQAEAGGLMSRLKNACLGEEFEVTPLDPAVRKTRQAVEKELRIIDPKLSEWFWTLYADMAWALASGSAAETERPAVRALLRYGMVAVHPGLIGPELRDFILNDCAKDVYEWANTPDALHVVYADEYITAIHDRQMTVSPDEDLELNSRGSDDWKADRVWRQATIYASTTELYTKRLEQLRSRVAQLTETCEKQKTEYTALRARSDSRAAALGDAMVTNRADLARLRQAVERFESKLLPELQERVEEANQRFGKASELFTPERVARREALFIRRLARLAARLKEPYLPFVLRDTMVPGRSDHFSRASVREAIGKIEQADIRVFHQMVIGNKRPDRRVTVRMSPTFLILPGRGQMGFSLCPRKWDDYGRLVLPIGFQRQNGLEPLLTDMISDYRWDCSKEEAGAEWIIADALCAAYAAVRWNYRRFSEKSQKVMGIDRKQKDRENWRLHYRLFVSSAADHGRYLYNKCYEVYKDVVLRHIGLPPGVEPLRRD
jgi:hypothetical protein